MVPFKDVIEASQFVPIESLADAFATAASVTVGVSPSHNEVNLRHPLVFDLRDNRVSITSTPFSQTSELEVTSFFTFKKPTLEAYLY